MVVFSLIGVDVVMNKYVPRVQLRLSANSVVLWPLLPSARAPSQQMRVTFKFHFVSEHVPSWKDEVVHCL